MNSENFKDDKIVISRRKVLRDLGLGTFSTIMISGCGLNIFELREKTPVAQDTIQRSGLEDYKKGKFIATPSASVKSEGRKGLYTLEIEKDREALVYVPQNYNPVNPFPFVLMLHGATGSPKRPMTLMQPLADELGFILLIPKSRDTTWDMITGNYGIDVRFIDKALKSIFENYSIDKSRLAVGGFSDGASYALSLGLINGNLFSHVFAFSPGFTKVTETEGKPRFYISHGTKDQILPIEQCSRVIVPKLKDAGYDVIYREFDGPHTIPPDNLHEALQWITSKN